MTDGKAIAGAIQQLAFAVYPDALPSKDATGGTVTSLCEALMGITAALTLIAGAIKDLELAITVDLADAIREGPGT